jgi:hypothetical protein
MQEVHHVCVVFGCVLSAQAAVNEAGVFVLLDSS